MRPRELGTALVAAVKPATSSYDDPSAPAAFREAIARLGNLLGWRGQEGTSFGMLVAAADRVLLKPNWVHDRNQGPWGLEPLVTHGAIIRAVAEELLAGPVSEVMIGDAPLQLCDFQKLVADTGVGRWAGEVARRDPRLREPRDFRRTRSTLEDGLRVAHEAQLPLDQFVLFDLGKDSLLEPITVAGQFRVTQYDPEPLSRTHLAGVHRYLIARDVLDATVIVNLPKLKTHRKAGMTGALKNLIGVNGNKEYLPHHRVGGTEDGGDCYPERSRLKRLLEFAYDQINSVRSQAARRAWDQGVRVLNHALRSRGDRLGVEGAWWGNDTIWRTCLDLNRIVLYGRADGTLAETPQRRVVHIMDAFVAGQGEGPLSAEPAPLGLLLGASNAAAMDWVGATVLGYDPWRLPICRHAFDAFPWRLTDFPSDDVEVIGDVGGSGSLVEVLGADASAIEHYPIGWVNAVRAGAVV
jgi:uncharacterized protein (DUF362 family)